MTFLLNWMQKCSFADPSLTQFFSYTFPPLEWSPAAGWLPDYSYETFHSYELSYGSPLSYLLGNVAKGLG